VEDHAGRVRSDEQLEWPRLQAWLREHIDCRDIPGIDLGRPMEVGQFHGGHSNLTYLLRFEGAELVMRRGPLGPVAPKAHDMAREYRWLAALNPLYSFAPRPYALCEDASVVGSAFYVMERRHGVVVRQTEPPGVAGDPGARRRISEAAVDALANLHAIDIAAGGLSSLGKPAGFVERQVRGWTDRWHRAVTTPVTEMDALAEWLMARLPSDPLRPSIVHGDFKLDNLMFDAKDVARLAAVFDWEMCALGDPLVDLGILLAYWSPTSPPEQRDALTPVTDRPGYLPRERIVERYVARTGRDLSNIRFFEIFALFKIAVVIQQIFYRFSRGQTSDTRFATFDKRVEFLARSAAALALA
jgi:aminoglycoside phosphotransferase (APT) family kinase protein